MLAARHKKSPDAMSKGIFGTSRLTAFVSKDSHYSIPKAAVQLGLGTDSIVYVDVDDDGRMISSDLERMILKSIENNDQVKNLEDYYKRWALLTELSSVLGLKKESLEDRSKIEINKEHVNDLIEERSKAKV